MPTTEQLPKRSWMENSAELPVEGTARWCFLIFSLWCFFLCVFAYDWGRCNPVLFGDCMGRQSCSVQCDYWLRLAIPRSNTHNVCQAHWDWALKDESYIHNIMMNLETGNLCFGLVAYSQSMKCGVYVVLVWFERVTGNVVGVHCEFVAGWACIFTQAHTGGLWIPLLPFT